MTIIPNVPLELLDCLKQLCSEATKDLVLPIKGENSKDTPPLRPPKIFGMNVPKKGDEIKQIPYILAVVQTGHDEQKPNENPESSCGVRIVAAVFNENSEDGKRDLLNILTRLRFALWDNRVLGKQFILRNNIDWAVDPAYTEPYHFGELLMSYDVPPVYPKTIDEYIELRR